MAAGLRPALNDARIRFALPSGIRIAALSVGRTDSFVTVFRLRRSISSLTACCNFRSSASSIYSSECAKSPGSLIRRIVSEVGNGRLLPLVSDSEVLRADTQSQHSTLVLRPRVHILRGSTAMSPTGRVTAPTSAGPNARFQVESGPHHVAEVQQLP